MYIQTGSHTGRQSHRQADIWAGKQTCRQEVIPVVIQSYSESGSHIARLVYNE